MSCDWNVHCVDCKDTHHFNDANHLQDLMLHLIAHRHLLEVVAPLFEDVPCPALIEIHTSWGYIDASWFLAHRGHHLVARSEYGDVIEPPPQLSGPFALGDGEVTCSPIGELLVRGDVATKFTRAEARALALVILERT